MDYRTSSWILSVKQYGIKKSLPSTLACNLYEARTVCTVLFLCSRIDKSYRIDHTHGVPVHVHALHTLRVPYVHL